jgi:hypothetical protein
VSRRLQISQEGWIDPRIEIKESSLSGKGMFAKKSISKGEIIIKWGGTLFTKEETKAGKARKKSVVGVDDGLYLAGGVDEPTEDSEFMNHSCNPNLWMKDAVTLEARRNIRKGEELTADYVMWADDYESEWDCKCGTKYCRQRISGKDWQLPELQKRYKGHFSPFINKRIKSNKF